MFVRTLVSTTALGGLVLMAFGSAGIPSADVTAAPKGDAAANKAACLVYYTDYNALECLPGGLKQESEEICDKLSTPYNDMVAYWACMGENTTCIDGVMDASGQSECRDLLGM